LATLQQWKSDQIPAGTDKMHLVAISDHAITPLLSPQLCCTDGKPTQTGSRHQWQQLPDPRIPDFRNVMQSLNRFAIE
jgi:hypothetical protein